MDSLHGSNMTNFFRREIFMYSLGDIKFKTPISLKRVVYTLVLLLIWTLPIVFIFGIHLDFVFAAIAVGPPLLLGYWATKPIFFGKTLMPFIKTIFNFLKEPKGWTDLKSNNTMNKDVYYVEKEIWVSRRREIKKLNELIKQKGGK